MASAPYLIEIPWPALRKVCVALRVDAPSDVYVNCLKPLLLTWRIEADMRTMRGYWIPGQVEILCVAVLGSMIEDVGLVPKLIERRITPAVVQVTTAALSLRASKR